MRYILEYVCDCILSNGMQINCSYTFGIANAIIQLIPNIAAKSE